MIKKLRRNFIIISMASVFLVLSIIIASINIGNYKKVTNNADEIISILESGGGSFSDDRQPTGEMQPDENFQKPNKGNRPEMRFETRFFVVKLYEDSEEANLGHIAAISYETAINMAKKVQSGNKVKGYDGNYRYKICKYDNYDMVIFVDCTNNVTQSRIFLTYSISISLIGLAGSFVLILILSKYVLKPVQESYDKQKIFISNASHELKTPLTIISANNELLEIEHGSDECNQEITNQVKLLTEMVHNLSTLAKIDEGKKANISEMNLTEATFDIINSFVNVYKEHKIDFSYNVDENIIINGDSNLIRELLSIIFDNARKYAKSYFKVEIKQENKKVHFTFENDYDDDSGIDTAHVFDRFYRSSNARANIEGSGIGLAIAKEIILIHKGKIESDTAGNKFIIKCEI